MAAEDAVPFPLAWARCRPVFAAFPSNYPGGDVVALVRKARTTADPERRQEFMLEEQRVVQEQAALAATLGAVHHLRQRDLPRTVGGASPFAALPSGAAPGHGGAGELVLDSW